MKMAVPVKLVASPELRAAEENAAVDIAPRAVGHFADATPPDAGLRASSHDGAQAVCLEKNRAGASRPEVLPAATPASSSRKGAGS